MKKKTKIDIAESLQEIEKIAMAGIATGMSDSDPRLVVKEMRNHFWDVKTLARRLFEHRDLVGTANCARCGESFLLTRPTRKYCLTNECYKQKENKND